MLSWGQGLRDESGGRKGGEGLLSFDTSCDLASCLLLLSSVPTDLVNTLVEGGTL